MYAYIRLLYRDNSLANLIKLENDIRLHTIEQNALIFKFVTCVSNSNLNGYWCLKCRKIK